MIRRKTDIGKYIARRSVGASVLLSLLFAVAIAGAPAQVSGQKRVKKTAQEPIQADIPVQESVPASDSLTLEQLYEPEFLPTAYYTEGVKLAAEENYTDALEMFVKAVELDPDHAPSLYETANIMMMLGDLNKALEYSERAAALEPGNIWYRGQMARLLVFQEKYGEALPLFESMLGRNHIFDPDNYRILSVLYHHLGRVDDAIATLDSAEMRMGRSPEITDLRRSLLIDAGRVDDAVAVTEAYVRATPYDEDNRLILADLYGYLQKDSMQIAMLKEVLEVNPDNVVALANLADYYLDRGSTGLHLATLKQLFLLDDVPLKSKLDYLRGLMARRLTFYRQNFAEVNDLALILVTHYPGDPDVMNLYAEHMIGGGDIEGALTMFKTLLERPEPRLEDFLQVIDIEAYLKRQDSVALYSDRALAHYPGEHRIYMMKSGALQYMGRTKEARKVLEKALKTAGPDSLRSEILGSLGTLWHEDGDQKKTYGYYEQALKYNPDNHHVLNNYAYFLAEEGKQLDRALGMASRAIKLQENSSTYLDTYAWVLYRLANYAEAKKIMQQALPLDRSNSPELLIHYGDILRALGENFMASVYWKRARDAGYEPAAAIEERLAEMDVK